MDCVSWLKNFMRKNGPALCGEIKKQAYKAGYTRAELKAARNTLGVESWHQFDEGGATQNWFWYLEG